MITKSPTTADLARFRREYQLMQRINDRHIPLALDMISIDGYWTIVMDDMEGNSLDVFLADRSFSGDLLSLAIIIARAVSVVHEKHIIHKDICPGNIVVSDDLKRVQIIDFGISAKLSHEEAFSSELKLIEGTLAYIAPEQTGRMNRPIDHRSDIYSLGATFFELFTGRLPFASADPLELIHSHVAKNPPEISELNSNVSRLLSRIIAKMLRKEPDERYQTMTGVIHDLTCCMAGDSADMPLGRRDHPSQFIMPSKLYGRDRAISTLTEALDRSAAGSVELVLVTGASGIGKSSVVNELNKKITSHGGFFAKGKFDQYLRNAPYLGFAQALRSLMSHLLALETDRLNWWRERIRGALGAQAKVIADVIPELHTLLGPIPDIQDLPSIEAANRLRVMFEAFLNVLTVPGQPLVIFLDDLQWADGGSLKLLEILSSHADQKSIVVILAFRDHEIDERHPAQITFNLLKERGVAFTRIELNPLTISDIEHLVVDALQMGASDTRPLAELLASRTAGNPYFMTQMLRSLFQNGIIKFDSNLYRFVYDRAASIKVPLADNVLDLVITQLRTLPASCADALAHAALIGAEFSLSALSNVLGVKGADLGRSLGVAIENGILVPLESSYRLLETADNEIEVRFRFGHDRLQQAAVQILGEEAVEAAHLAIGRYFISLRETRALLDAANHLYSALPILSQDERRMLPDLCLRAGNEAVRTAAYDDAFDYYERGLIALGEDCWQTDPVAALGFHVRLVEIGYNAGRPVKLEAYFAKIKSMSDVDHLSVSPAYIAMAGALRQMGRYVEAIDVSCAGLALLGAPLPRHPSLLRVAVELLMLKLKFNIKTANQVNRLTELRDRRHMAISDLYAEIAGAAFFVDKNMLALSLVKRTNHALIHGMSESGANGIAAYAAVMAGTFKEYSAAHNLTHLLVKSAQDRGYGIGYLRTAIIAYGLVNAWQDARRDETDALEELAHASLANGDLEWGCNALFLSIINKIYCSDDLRHLGQMATAYYDLMGRYQQRQMQFNLGVACQLIGQLTAKPSSFMPILSDGVAIEKMLEDQTAAARFNYYSAYIIYNFLNDRYAEAVQKDILARPFLWSVENTGMPFVQARVFAALAILANKSPGDFDRSVLRQLRPGLGFYKKLGRVNPRSFGWIYPLLIAEVARLEGRVAAALHAYQKSRRLAAESGFFVAQALTFERSGRFGLRQGDPSAAQLMREAHHYYSAWGATAKVKLLEYQFPNIHWDIAFSKLSAASIDAVSTSLNRADHLDLESIVRACQAISGVLNIDELINTLAKIMLETAGATRGLIFIKDGPDLRSHIEASYSDVFHADRHIKNTSELVEMVALSLVNYVSRTYEMVAIADCSEDHQFRQDIYFASARVRSLACIPIQGQGELLGILYLENGLAARAFTPERLKTLGLLAAQGAISLRNIRHATDMRERVRLEGQMRAAQAVQTALLPSPERIPGISISTAYIAAEETGGDWYGYQYDADRHRLFLQIGDVTGHGIPSALVTGAVSGAVSSVHALLAGLPEMSDQQCLELLIRATDRAVANSGLKTDLWMTMGFVVINMKDGVGIYHNAGHLPLYLKSGDTVRRLHSVGSPLGIVGNISIVSFEFKPGDILLMITDGLIENGTASGGRRRFSDLKKLVAAAKDDIELKAMVLASYEEILGSEKAADDCTLLAMKRVA